MSLPDNLQIPQHVGIIMDGNGRWAKKRGLLRGLGHRAGAKAARRAVEACGELGISYLTIYAFSAENWGRPSSEVKLLMELFVEVLRREIEDLNKNNVRLRAIGNISKLPKKTKKELEEGLEATKNNTGLNLVVALNYGGRDDIVYAARKIAEKARTNPEILENLDESYFASHLYTEDIPDPEIIIRTSGEQRISNFLIWQAAYSEFYFTDVLWPDFEKKDLIAAIEEFNRRDRRFGKVK